MRDEDVRDMLVLLVRICERLEVVTEKLDNLRGIELVIERLDEMLDVVKDCRDEIGEQE